MCAIPADGLVSTSVGSADVSLESMHDKFHQSLLQLLSSLFKCVTYLMSFVSKLPSLCPEIS